MQTSNITTKGQITIPVQIRKSLGLKSGQQVAFKLEGNMIILQPVKKDISAAFGLIKTDKTVSLEAMDKAIQDEATHDWS